MVITVKEEKFAHSPNNCPQISCFRASDSCLMLDYMCAL